MNQLSSLKLLVLALAVCLGLFGCAQTRSASSGSQMGNLLLAEPLAISPQSEMMLARYNQILGQATLTEAEKAQLLYQRGILYDSLGLVGLAHFDFSLARKLKPDMAEVYNSLGVHLIQRSEFTEAYEAFDSTLDIDPTYDFAFLNRGIALYYGGRPQLAVSDLETFVSKDESDPFRALWAFFAHYDLDQTVARQKLIQYKKSLDPDHWALSVVDLLLGQATETQVLDRLIDGISSQRELSYRLCEAYFYLGKYHSMIGQTGKALNYFKLALSTNVYEYVEHRYSRLELARLRDTY